MNSSYLVGVVVVGRTVGVAFINLISIEDSGVENELKQQNIIRIFEFIFATRKKE